MIIILLFNIPLYNQIVLVLIDVPIFYIGF
jgi:hypothetical protein